MHCPRRSYHFNLSGDDAFGDYRVVARIEDARVVILVVRVGHRREVYR